MSTITQSIKLSRPIERQSGAHVEELTLREPTAGELRGLKVFDLLQADIDAVIKLVPRIAMPTVIAEEVERLHPSDLAALAGEIVGFFLNPEQQAQAEIIRQRMN